MYKIAVLGPQGTFTEMACLKFIKNCNIESEIFYFTSISKAVDFIEENDLLILPIENTIDGYVQETIDFIIKSELFIIADLQIPVDFTFVSNGKSPNTLYVQYKAKGQCLNFIEKNNFKIVQTENNIESLELLLKADENYGAIIPTHKVKDYNFSNIIENVKDQENNYTRFLVLSKDDYDTLQTSKVKCSLCIHSLKDKPGLLYDILKNFYELNLNLISIISKPTKEGIGKYNFFIEISLLKKNIKLIDKLLERFEITKECKIKILGIYSSID